MKRNRFDKISQYLHVADNTTNPPRGQPGHDKLAHVRPILDDVREKCRTLYRPHQNVSIDEAMVAFRGRLSWRQYVPSKPTKYGMKVWVRASPVNGFLSDFQVYTGRAEINQPEESLGARVVKDLSVGLSQGSIVNCDNFFSSPALFTDLLARGIYARGTIRVNRKGMPPQAQFGPKKLKRQGESVVMQQGRMVAAKWQDKRTVNFLTTADDAGSFTQVKRKKKDGSSVLVDCPTVVEEYNNHMNGVDHADQLRNVYPTYRKSRKWWHLPVLVLGGCLHL